MEMKNVNWKELFIDIIIDIVAGMIIAVGIYNFALNADFPVAGFSGIAIILYHLFGLPVGAGTIIFQKQIVRGLTTAAGIWATAGIGLAVGAGMYTIGIAATVLTLVGLELLSYLFKSIGMKSSMVSFSTPNKDILKQIADRFNSKDYLIVSYEMETQHTGEAEYYQVTMVIKSKRNNDEGHLLSLIQEFPDVTVQRIE